MEAASQPGLCTKGKHIRDIWAQNDEETEIITKAVIIRLER